jgi:hypothetical protein
MATNQSKGGNASTAHVPLHAHKTYLRACGSLHRGIHHPAENTVIYLGFLAACGLVPDQAGIVTAVLLDSANNVMASGFTVSPAPRWIVCFEDIPAGGPYTLELRSSRGYAIARSLGLWPADVDYRKLEAPGITIIHPLDGDSVCQSMPVAYGTSTDLASISGTFSPQHHHNPSSGQAQPANPTSIQGTLYPNGNWVIQFPAVGPDPRPLPYTLTITGVDGGGHPVSATSNTVYAQPC